MAGDDLKTLTPTFIVYIDGARIPVDQEAAVKRIVVNDRLDIPSTCAITLSDPKRQWTDSPDFEEGKEIKIELGYKDNMTEVFVGEIVGMLGEFRRGADDIVTLRCATVLHRLARGRQTTSYTEKSDKDILSEIVSACGLSLDCTDVSTKRPYVVRKERSDYEYIMDIANRNGCFVWADKKKVCVKKTPNRSGDPVIVEWGKTLLEFRSDCDCRKIFTEVEVLGWDNAKGQSITGKAKASQITDKVGGSSLAPKLVKDSFCDAKRIVMDQEVVDANGADALALEILTANSFTLFSAEGRAEGNGLIKAGGTLNVKEAGTRFSGDYVVTSVKHSFDCQSGFYSEFSLTRNAL